MICLSMFPHKNIITFFLLYQPTCVTFLSSSFIFLFSQPKQPFHHFHFHSLFYFQTLSVCIKHLVVLKFKKIKYLDIL